MKSKFIKQLTPPILFNLLRHYKNGFRGNFENYSEAEQNCFGYKTDCIINNTVENTKKYKLECLNNKPIHNQMNILSAILLALYELKDSQNKVIEVLDFGGSMGVHYFLLKHHLGDFIKFNWVICETETTVKAARENFAEEGLTFVSSLDSVPKTQHFDIILTSSSLQYTDKPYDYYLKLLKFHHSFLIIDRFPIANITKDRLTIQKTAKSVYNATYPAWFFSEEKWMALISDSYNIKLNWDSTDSALLDFKEIICQGYLLKRK